MNELWIEYEQIMNKVKIYILCLWFIYNFVGITTNMLYDEQKMCHNAIFIYQNAIFQFLQTPEK